MKFSGGFNHVKRGRRADLSNRFFRSRMESNFGRYLNFLVLNKNISKWEYEADTFEFPVKKGTRFYTPDFKVWDNDGNIEYFETKGFLTKKGNTQLKRMAKYYPSIKLTVVKTENYKAIERAVSGMIPNWE